MIRDFRPGDQTAVRELVLDGLRERWGAAFDDSFNQDLADIRSSYLDDGAEVVVAELADRIVATGMLIFERPRQARIVRMSVVANRRREGLARQMVEELIARARLLAVEELHVSTDTPWHSAVALYRSCGFAEVSEDGTDTHFVMAL